jgi:hypothetical protein
LLLHGADSSEISSTRIQNFIKIESEPKFDADSQCIKGKQQADFIALGFRLQQSERLFGYKE